LIEGWPSTSIAPRVRTTINYTQNMLNCFGELFRLLCFSHSTKVPASVAFNSFTGGKSFRVELGQNGDSSASEPIIYLGFGVESTTVDVSAFTAHTSPFPGLPRATRHFVDHQTLIFTPLCHRTTLLIFQIGILVVQPTVNCRSGLANLYLGWALAAYESYSMISHSPRVRLLSSSG